MTGGGTASSMSSDAQIAREWAETRALADMTPAEQAQCVGMWADVTVAGMTFTEVIGAPPSDGMVTLVDPNGGRIYQLESLPLDEITPRFDLPRAWTPDGEPVPGEWEEKIYQDGIGDYIRFTRQRRYITDWEVPHESR